MSKAEKYISDCTRNCSNELIAHESRAGKEVISYNEWLTPDQARKAVEIARKEVIEQTAEWLTKHAIKYYVNSKGFLGTDELVKDYKLIMSMEYEKCTQEP